MATNLKVLSNAFAQFFGKVLTVMAAFFVVKIVSGYGPEFYGNYVTAYEFLAFFGIIADMGLFAIAVRDISKYEGGEKQQGASTEKILGNLLSLRLILIAVVTIIAGLVAQLIGAYPEMVRWGIWITGISMALTIVAGTLSAILQARMKIAYFSGSLVFGKILLAIMIFIIAQTSGWFGEGMEALFFQFLAAGVISNTIFCGLVYYFASREIPIRLAWDTGYIKKTLKESVPYGAALVLQTLYLRVDLILISIILGAQAIGIYGVAARVMESFLILGVFFGQSLLPKLSAEEGSGAKASRTLSWALEILLICSLPILLGMYFFASDVVALLSSAEFLSSEGFFGADKALLILVPTVLFAFFNQAFSFALVSKQKQFYLLGINAAGLALNVGLNLYFLPIYGLISAAISTVVCELLVFVLLVHLVRQHFIFDFRMGNVIGTILVNIGLFLFIALTPLKDNLILSLALCSLIYIFFLYTRRKSLVN